MTKKYVSDVDYLVKFWDYSKNTCLPEKITTQSNKKFYWLCENGISNHTYLATVVDKFRDKTLCPYCSNHKVLKGFNDLATTKPDLLLDWDYSKNTKLPTEITSGSSYKAYWKCHICGHEWQVQVSSRKKGAGCKRCSIPKGISKRINLLLESNGSLLKLRPDLAREYLSENSIGADQVTLGSHQKAHWKCSKCGYEWDATVTSRVQGNGCPACGKLIAGVKNRQHSVEKRGTLAEKYPNLLLDWDYSKNDIDPNDISPFSHYNAHWKCHICGREWLAVVKNRTIQKQDCTCLLNSKISSAVIKSHLNKGGSLGNKYPCLINDWDSQRNNFSPFEVSPFSQRSAYWKCSKCGYEWEAKVVSRTSPHLGLCPKCSRESKTSFPEQTILFYLSKIFTCYGRYKYKGYEIDIYIPELNVGFEYDGLRYHNEKKKTFDDKKTKFLAEQGVRLYRIKETHGKSDNQLTVNVNQYTNSLTKLIKYISQLFNINIDVNIKRDEIDIYKQYVSTIKQNNLVLKFPNIAKEWNHQKNGNIVPEMVSFGTNKKYWWKCSKCGTEWIAAVQLRTSNKGGHCPNCWVGKKVGRPKKIKSQSF